MDWNSFNNSFIDPEGLLTSEDILFIQEVLGADLISLTELVNILEDDQLRQDILDSRCLSDTLLDNRTDEELNVSEYFYYNTIIRRILLDAGLNDIAYSQQVTAAIVRIANCQKNAFEKNGKEAPRYFSFNLTVMLKNLPVGYDIKILGSIEPYRVILQGNQEVVV